MFKGQKKADHYYPCEGGKPGWAGKGRWGPDSMLPISKPQGSHSGPSAVKVSEGSQVPLLASLPFLPHSGCDPYLPFREACGKTVHSTCSKGFRDTDFFPTHTHTHTHAHARTRTPSSLTDFSSSCTTREDICPSPRGPGFKSRLCQCDSSLLQTLIFPLKKILKPFISRSS